MRIRRATADDVSVLVAGNRAIAHETEDVVLDPELVAIGVAAVIADEEKGFYLVAETNGVIGQLLVTREWSDWRNGWYWWIQSVYVAPAHRRRGVYRALHEEVVALAKRAGVLAIKLYVDRDNERARATYRSLGMTPARYDIYETEIKSGRASSS
jgi:ribosomal protein S18 acetylase RimI-like enzyme